MQTIHGVLALLEPLLRRFRAAHDPAATVEPHTVAGLAEPALSPPVERRQVEGVAASTSIETITGLIGRFSSLYYEPLRFPQALEDGFETDTAPQRCKRFWFESLIVLVLFNLMLVADYASGPGSFVTALWLRAGLITPLALLVNIGMLFRPAKVLRESSIAFVACLAGLANLYLERHHGAVISVYAQFGIVAVILFANTLMRLRLPYALASTSLMLAGDLLFLKADAVLSPTQKGLGLVLTAGVAAGTLVANYSSGREERLNYLLRKQSELILNEMSRANLALRTMAERDSLTGMANRYVFERRMEVEWERARKLKSALTLILIDIDHFKQINDSYGHAYGDRVLRRTGNLLVEALRRKGDLAARYGGEEFILLLPNTGQDPAMRVADRIRTLVQAAGLPALESGEPPHAHLSATVSCGVAGTTPTMSSNYHSLIEAADRALYRAKTTGRNRVCGDRTYAAEDEDVLLESSTYG